MSNIDEMIAQIDEINGTIFKLQSPIAAQIFDLEQRKKELQEQVTKAAYEQAREPLSQNDYGCGTVNFETAHFKIKTVVSKNVKWDDKELRNVEQQIKTAGQDPEAYITYKRSVSETAFKKFPENIQNAFLAARTLEPSAPKVTWERK